MYEIHIRVSFADHTLTKHGLSVFEGDYNSTELVFHFDEDTSDKFLVFEMDNTHGETLLIQELVDNRIALTARNDKGEICSLFNEAGLYPFHIVMYGKNRSSKITSVPGWLTVNKRQVYETDEKIKAQLPIFDTLVEIVSEGNFCTAEALENAVANLNSTISFINTQLRDTKIEYKMMKYDGVNIKDGSTVVGFEDIKRYYSNPKYFMYLEYNNIICIPASNPETDTEVEFIGAFATSGTITQCSIIVKSDGTINSIQIPMENTDYKVKEFDEYEDDGTYDKYFSAHAVYNKMLTKVDKVNGKGLSTNDFTDKDRNKLDKLGAKYSPITTIVLKEGVSIVDYAFTNPLSKMFVQGYVPNKDVGTSDKVVIYAMIDGLTAGFALMSQIANGVFSTADAYWGYLLDVSEGMLEQYISNIQAINTGRASYTRQISATQSSFTGKLKSIKQIRFSTAAFPVGTTITIYGMEA